MLTSFKVKNFGPFAGEVCFSTEVEKNKSELLERNTYNVEGQRINKITYIYGANGSGKSNLFKAIDFLKALVFLSPIIASNNEKLKNMMPIKDDILDNKYFKLNKINKDLPTELSIELIIDGIRYNYGFAFKDGKIIKEFLTKKRNRTQKILDRNSSDYNNIILKSDLSSFKSNVSVVKENVLCLSMAAFLNNDLSSKIIDSINEIDIVSMAANKIGRYKKDMSNEENIKRYLKYLKIADPTLKDLDISIKEKTKIPESKIINDFENRKIITKSINVNVESIHNIYEEDKIVDTMRTSFLEFESNGTIKLFAILPTIIDVLDKGSTLFIDEVENGLHPLLVKKLIDLFNDPEINIHDAQLICTTHDVTLMEKNIRRDQVWFMYKDKQGRSSIKRLSNFNVRANDNFAKKYMENAFGSLPTFFNDSEE